MKFYEISNLNEIKKDNNSRIVALGFFDGLHIAHAEIIKNTINKAKKENKISTLITFDKSPKEYFTKKKIKQVTPTKTKKTLLEKMGLEELYILEFNDELRFLDKDDFIKKVLIKLNITEAYCGDDYLFGYKGEGTPKYIEQYTDKIKVNILPIKNIFENKISTTKLKEFIKQGNFKEYTLFTKRAYEISGKIISGKQLGRTINFPTANLFVEKEFLIPEKLGVYITKVLVRDKLYTGITNIGKNPTVSNDDNITIETHILNFDKEIYGENITLYFYEFLRFEKKFKNMEELKVQLTLDKEIAEKYKF